MFEVKFLSEDGNCLRERDIELLRKEKSKPKTYALEHDHLGSLGKIKTRMVYVEQLDDEFIADLQTGSLYHPDTLRCLTGALELK